MPGKSRRSRGRHSAGSKKRRDTLARVAQQQGAVETYAPAVPAVPTSSPAVPGPIAKPSSAQYHHIIAELRRIAILAGIMLAILVVLALALP